ncbi:hypothetical protein [Allokutzneria oryzae]|uniref:Uncharacterized protein n=1 Tax=Allokutzneria oryzae TaxID=1378989 RepID=A0ABV5ZUD4_9PSEU
MYNNQRPGPPPGAHPPYPPQQQYPLQVFPAQPQQPPLPQQPQPQPGKPKGSGRRKGGLALILLGVLPLLLSGAIVGQAISNSRQLISNKAFVPKAWHNLRTDEIFPEHLGARAGRAEQPGWSRQAIAKESGCAEALRTDFGKSAMAQGCVTTLRGTYVDIGGTFAITLAVVVVGSYEQAQLVAEEYFWATDPGPLVQPVAAPGTPAAEWTKDKPIAGGATSVGLSTNRPPYVVAVSVGPADGSRDVRSLPGEWKGDSQGEARVYQNVVADVLNDFAIGFNDIMRGKK